MQKVFKFDFYTTYGCFVYDKIVYTFEMQEKDKLITWNYFQKLCFFY